jgi:AcrR family transcriptional regulator
VGATSDATNDRQVSTADRLADAAISIIAREGFDALSVRRVAREARVTGGTVQHHYPSKVELTVAALDRTVHRQSARLASVPSTGTPLDRLTRELCALLPNDPVSTEEAVVWIAMSAAVPGHPFVANRRRQAADQARVWIASRLRRAQEAGVVDASIDMDDASAMIEAALDGVMQQAVADHADTVEDSCRRLCRMVQRLLVVDDA